MSSTQVPLGQVAMAVLMLASSAEQFVLPYVQARFEGQQAGHPPSALGGSVGQGGLASGLPPTCQAPRVHRARRVPHCPKSHVVPSGRRQTAPFVGIAPGQSSEDTEPVSPPPSASGGVLSRSSAQAPAAAMAPEPSTRISAICPVIRGPERARREREVAATRRE